jgi:tetratricopeptide (TPR) repeat protein
MSWKISSVVAIAGLAWAGPVVAAETVGSYAACIGIIDTNPALAFDTALDWRDRGGGLPAEHCAALALISLDEAAEAASRLGNLAARSDAGDAPERAKLLTEAGNAWLLASQWENADTAFSAALKLTPRDPELWTDRARARAARQNWTDAEKDLTNAITFEKARPETYVLRASARAAQGDKMGYKTDIDAALAIDPTFPEALVERGSIRLEAGDKAGARADWLQVLVRAPDSRAGDAVRTRIEMLEIPNPDGPAPALGVLPFQTAPALSNGRLPR